MKSISLYVDLDSPLHRLDPLTKISYTLVFMLIPFLIPLKSITLICLGLTLSLLWLGRVIKHIVPIISFSLFLLFTIFLIQGLFHPANEKVAFSILGLTFYQEGLEYALGLSLRFINLLCCTSIIILATKPSDLIQSLVRRGLSPRFGYVMSSVLQIIPQMSNTTQVILDAQKSRGMETEGNLFVRAKAYIPLLAPLVMSSLVSANDRSLALEVRAFNAQRKRTFLSEEKVTFTALIFRFLIFFSFISSIVWRLKQ